MTRTLRKLPQNLERCRRICRFTRRTGPLLEQIGARFPTDDEYVENKIIFKAILLQHVLNTRQIDGARTRANYLQYSFARRGCLYDIDIQMDMPIVHREPSSSAQDMAVAVPELQIPNPEQVAVQNEIDDDAVGLARPWTMTTDDE
jgi:hypothetical protein